MLIADGQALVRAGLRVLLATNRRITVVGEAACGEEAVALAGGLRPDVVLFDARLPGLDSVEATGRMLSESRVAVMLPTANEGDEHIFAALRRGQRPAAQGHRAGRGRACGRAARARRGAAFAAPHGAADR